MTAAVICQRQCCRKTIPERDAVYLALYGWVCVPCMDAIREEKSA